MGCLGVGIRRLVCEPPFALRTVYRAWKLTFLVSRNGGFCGEEEGGVDA